ncbi:MAG: ACP phosphodiesterase [Saprospiraceae bacterium]|nr:MAG: ACP phosphodiesterase [Saprospiraceae bacterium]
MNFLAHLYLTRHDPVLTVGNFLGDMLTNRQVAQLPQAIQKGVKLHRAIDQFTDNHPANRQTLKLLRPRHGRYAGVVLDLLQDYLLSENWHLFMPEKTLREFSIDIYEILLGNLNEMPPPLRERTQRMVEADWLMQYANLAGLEYAFSRLQLRTSRPQYIEHATLTLREFHQPLTEGFLAFFPDVITFVDRSIETY